MHLNIKEANGKYYVFVIVCLCSLLIGILVNMLVGWTTNNKSVLWNDGKYTGDLVNGIPNGNGCFVKDGITYTGYWYKGEITNGTMKTDKIHPLDALLNELNITHKLIRPRTPRHNGKVERSHRNDQQRFYSYLQFYSYDDLLKQMKAYLKRSNNIPMQSLNWLSPLEMRQKIIEKNNIQ